MACPYFIPSSPHPRELWTHRRSLPLGDGFLGHCATRRSEAICDDDTLRLQCNLGYAQCAYLPAERELDAVRFCLQAEGPATLRVQFCGERAHRPAVAGELRFDRSTSAWLNAPDPQIAALADAAVRAWIASHARGASTAQDEISCDAKVSAESNKE